MEHILSMLCYHTFFWCCHKFFRGINSVFPEAFWDLVHRWLEVLHWGMTTTGMWYQQSISSAKHYLLHLPTPSILHLDWLHKMLHVTLLKLANFMRGKTSNPFLPSPLVVWNPPQSYRLSTFLIFPHIKNVEHIQGCNSSCSA